MKKTYMVFYNLAQFLGWLGVLLTGRLDLLIWFQTIQLLEVVHCMVGLVKSSAIQTFVQIASRIFIVWCALIPYPETKLSIGYKMILWAWPLAETTRYIYYSLNLINLNLYVVTWMRYSFFIGLYPLGVGGESLILYKLFGILKQTGGIDYTLPNPLNISFYAHYIIILVIIIYIPSK